MIEAGKMSIDEAVQYKNKFFEFKVLQKKVIVLKYFLNPYTRYSKFQATINKKLQQLYKDNFINANNISLVKAESLGNIRAYYYQIEH